MEFQRPLLAMSEQSMFSPTEVGITHPYTNAFIRLTDDGDIELVAGPGLAMILHPQNRSLTIVADSVKFVTKEQGGLRWNKFAFNPQADQFQEPALIPWNEETVSTLFSDLDDFFEGD